MPHDVTGKRVEVGQQVALLGTVTAVHAGEVACNFTVKI